MILPSDLEVKVTDLCMSIDLNNIPVDFLLSSVLSVGNACEQCKTRMGKYCLIFRAVSCQVAVCSMVWMSVWCIRTHGQLSQ